MFLIDDLTSRYFTAGLALLMLSMGITLTPKDFADVAKNPASVIIQASDACRKFMIEENDVSLLDKGA